MADLQELNERIEFRRSALKKLRAAYIALVDGGVKSYTIGDRELTHLDLPSLRKQIAVAEAELDNLMVLRDNKKPRKAFGVIPCDW